MRVLRTFESEAEARVVESFLTSHGIAVQVIGTFSKYTTLVPGRAGRKGIRILIEDQFHDQALQLLEEQERTAHLSLVNEDHLAMKPPSPERGLDRIVMALIVLLIVVFIALRHWPSTQ